MWAVSNAPIDLNWSESCKHCADVGRDLAGGIGLVATVATQRVVNGNNGVTFPIRRSALTDAILSANKQIDANENGGNSQ